LKKLVAYITTSLPDNNFTIDLAYGLKDSGVDILELGVPFSDPVADGVVIEKANLLALKNGFKLKDLFEISSKIGKDIDTLWMGYMNMFYHYGIEEFLKKAQEYNIAGTIIPDLSFEMAQKYDELFKKYNKANITFVAPTTPKSKKNEDLSQVIKDIKEFTKTPIYIGFGVDEKTCKQKAKDVDGVIVGSAFVRYIIDDSLNNSEKISKILKLAKEIKRKINE